MKNTNAERTNATNSKTIDSGGEGMRRDEVHSNGGIGFGIAWKSVIRSCFFSFLKEAERGCSRFCEANQSASKERKAQLTIRSF